MHGPIKGGEKIILAESKMSRGICGKKQEDIENAFIRYYQNLFTTGGQVEPERCLSGTETRVTTKMNNVLMRDFNCEEITEAIHQMSPQKAPRHDGFSVGFFHESWEVVGDEVCQTILSILNSGVIV